MSGISGVAVATVTPFGPGGSRIHYGLIRGHLEMLAADGVHGFVPIGTNGEFCSLTLEEKKRMLLSAGRAKGSLFMMAGVGSCSLPEVLELLDYAADAGADAALVVPPYYFKDVEQVGIVEFYRRVLEGTDLPVFLYNIPAYSGVTITDGIIDSLIGHANLAGVKDTGGDPERTRELVKKYPGLKIFGGSDSLVGEAVVAGAAGVISGVANAFPRLLYEAWMARSSDDGLAVAVAKVNSARKALTRFPWIAATKYALRLKGLPEIHMRAPLVDLTDDQKVELEKQLAELELL
ncbi:MAG: dihydrodipicolinate synthase family protein [Thermoleophilia bacterium]